MKFVAFLLLLLALTSVAVADGTDPVPLCRPSPTRGCPKPF